MGRKNEDWILCFPKYEPGRKMVASYRPFDLETSWIDLEMRKGVARISDPFSGVFLDPFSAVFLAALC